MNLPSTNDPLAYAGSYVIDLGEQTLMGFSAEQVAVILESERYPDAHVYKVVRAYPDGRVLSRRTGFRRNYGRNPYAGYDDVSDTPFNFPAQGDKPQPKEKLIAVGKGDSYVAYPYSVASRVHVIEDEIAGEPVVVFYDEGAVSALDNQRIALSRRSGSTGVFDRRIGDLTLNFSYHNGMFYDQQTQSIWDITGQAVDGEMKGKKLRPIAHGDYFSFAWITFRPETSIYRIEE